MILPEDPKERKALPMYSGLLCYFPKALAAVAKQSMIGHLQHYSESEPLHWDRSRSQDDRDALVRHLVDLIDAEQVNDKDKRLEAVSAIAWRALAIAEKVLDES